MDETRSYGQTRERGANVSYAEIERAALDILATERRPSVETVRERLGRGSPATIATFLKRFWRDLGTRAQGDPAALTRLPPEITDAVDAIWQRSLALAGESAKHDHNAARERLGQIRIENEVRAQSFDLRERAYESAARERERALADSRDHLLATLKMLDADRVALQGRDARIAELEAQLEESRARLAKFMARTLAKNRRLHTGPGPARMPARSSKAASRRPKSRKRRATGKSKRPSRR